MVAEKISLYDGLKEKSIMKIAIVNNHMAGGLGGSELQCHLIATGLAEKGHDISYIASNGSVIVGKTSNLSYPVISVKPNGYAIATAIIREKSDSVYWRFNKRHIRKVLKLLSRRGIPLVFAVSSDADLQYLDRTPIRRISDPVRAIYRFIRSIYEISSYRHVSSFTVLNPELIELVPHNSVFFVANSVPLDQVNFTWPRPYIVWVANIKPRKRPEEAIALGPMLDALGVDLLMVGSIQHSDYQRVMDTVHLPRNVYYLGKKSVEEVNGILSGALFHVHTCMPEGFGNIFIQAWFMGRPSVSLGYDPGGYLSRHEIGITAEDNREKFSETIKRWILNREELCRYGHNALKIANMEFTTTRMIDQVEEILITTANDFNKKRVLASD